MPDSVAARPPVRALVVDDETDVQFLFTQKFRREVRQGLLEFVFATSGQEALDTLRDGAAADVVVVLSDINMPGMSGLELLASVREEFPGLEVYMVTAYDDGQLKTTALEGGARGYLTKPIDFSTLKEEVFGLDAA
jgi:CheY-like chemotaxis protein